jgi:hypothetical protein
MERKKTFEPGDMVATYTGQAGMVISEEEYAKARKNLREGRRPGYYFAPGCYVIQVPVLFEDGMYDVMRAINIRRAPGPAEEKRMLIKKIIDNQCG